VATLTYDFESDSVGSYPAGWALNDADTDSCDTVIYLGDKVFLVSGDSGSAQVRCTDVTGNLDDVIVETSFIRLGASNEAYVSVRTSGTDLNTWTGYRIGSQNSVFLLQKVDQVTNPILDSVATVAPVGTWYKMKIEATGTTIRGKIWAAGDAEPGTWSVSASDATYSTGSMMLASYRSNYFDDVSIESDDISAGADVTQNATAAIAVAGLAPVVGADTSFTTSALGSIDIAGYKARLVVDIPATAGAVTVAGYDPAVQTPVYPNKGSVLIKGYNVSLPVEVPQLLYKFKDASGRVRTYTLGGKYPSLVTEELKVGGIDNNLRVDSAGRLTLTGDATVWDDLRFPALSLKLLGFSDPDPVQLADDGAGSTGVYSLGFSNTQDQEVFCAVQLPHEWKEGSDIYPHVHWAPNAATVGDEGVTWALEYSWANIGVVDGVGTPVAFGNTSTITIDDIDTFTAKEHRMINFAPVSATGKTFSSMLMCRLYRDVSDPSDDYGDDALLLEFDIHYEIDSLGSDTRSTK